MEIKTDPTKFVCLFVEGKGGHSGVDGGDLDLLTPNPFKSVLETPNRVVLTGRHFLPD